MKYTYSDEEDGGSDVLSTRRSNRQSSVSTPAEPSAPTFTASGRQVKSRHGGSYGESILAGQVNAQRRSSLVGMDGVEDHEEQVRSRGRPRRTAQHLESKPKSRSLKHIEGYNSLDSMDYESDATSSEGEWNGGEAEEPDDQVNDEEEDEDLEMSGDDEDKATDEEEERRQTLVVSLRYLKNSTKSLPDNTWQEVQLAQGPPIPLVISSVIERPKPSDALEPTANAVDGNTGVISQDGSMAVSQAAPSMPSMDQVGQKASIKPQNGLLQKYTAFSQVAAHDTYSPRFGTEDSVVL